MVNIWEFLLQTISVSLVAGLLLILKAIFKDKLSPRWQYGVWIILVLRILIPVEADKYVLLPFGVYLEALKSVVETRLNSAYTSAFSATQPSHIFPYVNTAPQSITDTLFAVYFAGVIIFLCYYLVSYLKLRLALKKGIAVSGDAKERIEAIFDLNKVKPCKTIYAEGINSAFICGVIRPVLVLPFGRETDDKVILHELMHLKKLDSLQSVFWCVLRCLHWCNPFLHYVFNIIGNDMESLCDQRVLEKLHGEERREYGILLLNEVNRKYARMPGTTSISNGGNNISKRIEAIVRFKKYPKGMALVSVCIVIVLSVPCLFVSTGSNYDDMVYYPYNEFQFEKALAVSRTNRCTTVAGAIDTYAKGLIQENGIMLLTASPQEKQEKIIEKLQKSYLYDSGFTSMQPSGGRPFAVFNLVKTDTDRYSAVLAFSIPEEKETEETNDDEYKVYGNTLLIPVEIFKEDNFWVVIETGERKESEGHLDNSTYLQTHYLSEDLPKLFDNTQKGQAGSLNTSLVTVFEIDYEKISSQNTNFFTDGIGYDDSVYLNADFSGCLVDTEFLYTYNGENYKDIQFVAAKYTSDMNSEFETDIGKSSMNYGSSSTDGSGERSQTVNDSGEWDRTLQDSAYNGNIEPKELIKGYSKELKYAIYIDGKLTEEFLIEVKTNE